MIRLAAALVVLAGCRIGFDPAASGDAADGQAVLVTVTVTTTAATGAAGSVSGLPCGSCTSAEVPVGTKLELTGVADGSSWFRGWTLGCAGRLPCELTVTEPTTVNADFVLQPNRIFLSAGTFEGDLTVGGIDGRCGTAATMAGLSGTWTTLVTSALGGSMFGSARGWIRTDGAPVADQKAQIGDLTLRAAIDLDENGNTVPGGNVWVIHHSFGGSDFCQDWTTNATLGPVVGVARGTYLGTGGAQVTCMTQAHVICAETDRMQPVDPVPEGGRKMFSSLTGWNDSTGVAGADAICATDAMNAGLAGSFKALLGSPGVAPLSRFDVTGAPWVRIDGTPMLPTAAAWATATRFDAAPTIGPDGMGLLYGQVAIGASALGSGGTNATTCDGWTNSSGTVGTITTWDILTQNGVPQACGASRSVLCLEE